jgi:hypothetical protein
MRAALFVLAFFFYIAVAYPVSEQRSINLESLVKIRCSLNEADETLFFFNGSVIAYPTAQATKVLFRTVGVNIGRCFKRADGSYTLAAREVLYYIDPVTDQIVDTWTNPWTSETVTVAHVDNDPVLQQFAFGSVNPVVVLGEDTILALDVPLFYPNALSFNPAMKPYSPQANYQAGEFFKFVAPTADVFGDVNTVSTSLVSWTRTGPWLPWMKQGNASGYLIYSSQGARIPSWTDLPQSVKNDFANRIPHYQHAPICVPDTKSVTSWSFFMAHFNEYLAGAKFPLATPANYSCVTTPTAAPTACRATAVANVVSTWANGGVNYYSINIAITNQGTQAISAVSVSIDNTVIDSAWNINRQGSSNVYGIQLWNTFAPGATLSGAYGFNSHGGVAVAAVASVSC